MSHVVNITRVPLILCMATTHLLYFMSIHPATVIVFPNYMSKLVFYGHSFLFFFSLIYRTLENDSYTNSRYSEAEHLPRVKIAQRPGTEMSENGQGSNYERLSSVSWLMTQSVISFCSFPFWPSPTKNADNFGMRSATCLKDDYWLWSTHLSLK